MARGAIVTLLAWFLAAPGSSAQEPAPAPAAVPDLQPTLATGANPEPAFAADRWVPSELLQWSQLQSGWMQRPVADWFRLDTPFMTAMLDFQNRQGDKHLWLLERQQSVGLYPEIVPGGQLRVSALAATTNMPGKFSYLGRFPGDFEGDYATDLRLLQANLATAVHFHDWISGYFETLFSDVFTFADPRQNSFQVRQAYVTLGNLERLPIYAFIGKKNVSFGDMRTLAPFSQSTVWHYFAPLAEGGGVGFVWNGLHAVVTALNGGRGIRVSRTQDKGDLNNFAANVSYEVTLGESVSLLVGGGYLQSTIYNSLIPEHTNPNVQGPDNPAWDVNATLRVGWLYLSGEFAETLDPWPAAGHRVQAFRFEAGIRTAWRDLPVGLAVSYSEGIQGPPGSEFEFNKQLVVGGEIALSPYAKLTAEYVLGLGFAPLIDLTKVSRRDAMQNSAVLGLVLVF